MKNNFKFLIFVLFFVVLSCQKNETENVVTDNEMSIDNIDVNSLNKEAKRYFGNMAEFISLTTPNIDLAEANKLKSTTINGEDSINPILDAFLNLEIEDGNGNQISFFDLSIKDREIFLKQWETANAYDMTPKLEDPFSNEDFEEYIQIQNDAFDEAMGELEQESDSSSNLKCAFETLSSNEVYKIISNKVQARIKEKSESYATAYLLAHPEISSQLKSTNSYPDYVSPSSVLSQLRTYADRGNILINLPGSVWLSAYLFYYNPLAIYKYIGIGKYPPGHVTIIRQTKTNISTNSSTYGFAISSQNGSGVRYENVYDDWNCKAHLCYVKKRVWEWHGWHSGFRTHYPNANKVIAYAESQYGKPYCSGWDFITAKGRTSCFICTTITWRSFDREGYNIHRAFARWMPTIAPADVYLSSHVKQKHRIK